MAFGVTELNGPSGVLMTARHLRSLVATLPTLRITANTTADQAMAAYRMLGSFNHCEIGLVAFRANRPGSGTPMMTCCTFWRGG